MASCTVQKDSKELTKADIKYLKAEIELMLEDDQKERAVFSLGTLNDSLVQLDQRLKNEATVEEYIAFQKTIVRDITKHQDDSLRRLQAQADFRNYKKIKNIINRFGYPSTERLGSEDHNVYPLFLHPPVSTDLATEDYLQEMGDLLKTEVLEGRMDANDFALFYDNILHKILGKPQLYGTVKAFDPMVGKVTNAPIHDLQKTNKARTEIGLSEISSQ